MITKGQFFEVEITDMAEDGKGIGKVDGLAAFVDAKGMDGRKRGADDLPARSVVPGDRVRACAAEAKKNYVIADAEEILFPSPDRVPSDCPYFGQCGGCTMRELSYDAQLRIKRDQVVSKLERIGGVQSPLVRDMIGADTLQYYRNKATFAVGPHGEVGFYRGKSNYVLDIEDCLLQTDAAMVCAEALRTFIRKFGVYCMTQFTVRTAFATGEIMAVIESTKKEIPHVDKLIEMLDDAVFSLGAEAPETDGEEPFSSLESVALIHSGKCTLLAGKPTILEEVTRGDGQVLKYEISPQSFFQVNPEQMVKLYDIVAEYALADVPADPAKAGSNTIGTLLDLYCGVGSIGIYLADKADRVVGIESVRPAVIDANRNSVINGLVNTRYIYGKAEEELPGMMGLAQLKKWNEVNELVDREPLIRLDRADAVVLDPPRAGCEEALLDAVVTAAPERIIYVSCDPGTLARDVKYLSSRGYQFVECTPVDQFPWTAHVECATLMTKA